MKTTIENLDNKIDGRVPSKKRSNQKKDTKKQHTLARLKILHKERFIIAKAIKGREPFGKNDEHAIKYYIQLSKIEKKIFAC